MEAFVDCDLKIAGILETLLGNAQMAVGSSPPQGKSASWEGYFKVETWAI